MTASRRNSSTRVLCLMALLLPVACSRPAGGEEFLTAPRNAYEFSLDVPDTLAFYDLAFYTRIDRSGREVLQPYEPLRLGIVWKAPSDSLFRETVWMMPGVDAAVSKYRSRMSFPSCGEWTLSVTVTPEVEGFRGLGLVWNSYYGT